jgi:hypothetical protein
MIFMSGINNVLQSYGIGCSYEMPINSDISITIFSDAMLI